ncbi:MAG: hypothetical protein AAF497_21840, partial [Planctomycetota bacterium]
MNHSLSMLILFFGLLATAWGDKPEFHLVEGDVVAFMGGTNMLRLVQSGHLETQLTDVFAKSKPKFRDLSWEADTVYRQGTEIERWRKDGFGGLEEQLKRLRVTHAFVQFGQLESMDGPEKLDEFSRAFDRFLTMLGKQVKTIVVLTPFPFESVSDPNLPDLRSRHAESRKKYAAVVARAKSRENVVCV